MRRINKAFDKVLFFTTAVFSIVFFFIVIFAVASRYIFKMPILASIELSRLFFVWSCFLAAALAFRNKAHVSITFLFDKFPMGLQKMVTICCHAVILVFLGIVFVQSIIVTSLLWPSRLPMLQISQSWFYMPVPVVSLILIFYTLEFLWDDLFHPIAEN